MKRRSLWSSLSERLCSDDLSMVGDNNDEFVGVGQELIKPGAELLFYVLSFPVEAN